MWYYKGMKKLFFSVVMALMMLGGVCFASPASVNADSAVQNYQQCGNQSVFFALKPWYAGLTTVINGKCEIGWPGSDGNSIARFVWTAVLNVVYDISMMVGYITILMIAFGGYLYMFSRGEPGRAEKGKKTLISAIIGLLIAMLSGVIMNTLALILVGNG